MEPGNPAAPWAARGQRAGSAGYKGPAAHWQQDRLRWAVHSSVPLGVRLGPRLCLASISLSLLLFSFTGFFPSFPNKPLAHKFSSEVCFRAT